MGKKISCFLLIMVLPLALVWGCGEQGNVAQGRVINYDQDNKTFAMILDIKAELGKPDYDQLPPVTFAIPPDPSEMGAEPKAGKLMKLDPDKNEIVIYDEAAQKFKTITYNPIDVQKSVGLRDARVAGKKFPIMDREKKAVTVYDKRKRVITTFALAEEFLAMPDSTFGFGDEIRIFYKEPGKSLRLMNISETDIYKK